MLGFQEHVFTKMPSDLHKQVSRNDTTTSNLMNSIISCFHELHSRGHHRLESNIGLERGTVNRNPVVYDSKEYIGKSVALYLAQPQS